MTITYCDLCEEKSPNTVRVKMKNGEHPHKGDPMFRKVDACIDCLKKIPDLESSAEFDSVRFGNA